MSAVPPKRALPFKRTAKPKQASTPEKITEAPKDDSLSLFEHRTHKSWLEAAERQAAEKAAQRRDKGKALEAERGHRDGVLSPNEDHTPDAQLTREMRESEYHSSNKERPTLGHRNSKRARLSVSDDDELDGGNSLKLPHLRTPPRATPKSPAASGNVVTTKPSPSTGRSTRTPKKTKSKAVEVITLSDSDDVDFVGPPASQVRDKIISSRRVIARDNDIDDSGLTRSKRASSTPDEDEDIVQIGDDSPTEADELMASYVRNAEMRLEQRKRERLEREASGSLPSSTPDPIAEILVESRLEGISVVKFKIQTRKQLKLVRDSWTAKAVNDGLPPGVTASVVNNMFFTWKGNKLYNWTTLENLGIKPDAKGYLLPSWESQSAGFVDRDKVFFEAWTQELFDEYQRDLDKERKRRQGDLDDEDDTPDPSAVAQPDKSQARIRVVLRSKDHGSQPLKVPPNSSVLNLVKAFRSMKSIPQETHIEIHFDGEKLDESSTIDMAGVEDLETLDVHVKS